MSSPISEAAANYTASLWDSKMAAETASEQRDEAMRARMSARRHIPVPEPMMPGFCVCGTNMQRHP